MLILFINTKKRAKELQLVLNRSTPTRNNGTYHFETE